MTDPNERKVVPMVRLPDNTMPRAIGEFSWQENDAGLWCAMVLPVAPDGSFVNIPVRRPTSDMVWWHDGNRDAPTFSPSIRQWMPKPDGSTVELWHGYVTAGRMETI